MMDFIKGNFQMWIHIAAIEIENVATEHPSMHNCTVSVQNRRKYRVNEKNTHDV